MNPLHTGDEAGKRGIPSLLSNPRQMSPEVQYKGISGPRSCPARGVPLPYLARPSWGTPKPGLGYPLPQERTLGQWPGKEPETGVPLSVRTGVPPGKDLGLVTWEGRIGLGYPPGVWTDKLKLLLSPILRMRAVKNNLLNHQLHRWIPIVNSQRIK